MGMLLKRHKNDEIIIPQVNGKILPPTQKVEHVGVSELKAYGQTTKPLDMQK